MTAVVCVLVYLLVIPPLVILFGKALKHADRDVTRTVSEWDQARDALRRVGEGT